MAQKESWRDERNRLLLWFALPLWIIVSRQAFKSGANANWAAAFPRCRLRGLLGYCKEKNVGC